jgi:LysM repeat protein
LQKVDEMSLSQKADLVRKEVGPNTDGNGSSTASRESENGRGWTQYTVQSGDALEKIAKEFGVSVSDLKTWNGIKGNKIVAGQSLEIYSEPEERTRLIETKPSVRKNEPAVAPSQSVGRVAEQTHRVKRRETITEIAQKFGVSAKELMNYNNLKSSKIKVNQVLKIPGSSSASDLRRQ